MTTKLILEENGKRRAFKLGDGVLTVGSGEAAKLRQTALGQKPERARPGEAGERACARQA